MAQAGAVPEEIRLMNKVQQHGVEMAKITDPMARKLAMAKLADLQMRQTIAKDTRLKFYR